MVLLSTTAPLRILAKDKGETMFTKKDILDQLEAMDAPQDKIVLMHTSLRMIGDVEGGANGLLDILVDYFTKDGGLFCLPTHTWHNYGKPITLDLASSESCLGTFPCVALRDGRGLRTENPSHSMVIFGDRDRATQFAKHDLDITSPTSPSATIFLSLICSSNQFKSSKENPSNSVG